MTGKFPRRGDIYWVSLDLTTGSETKKTRPCLIIFNDLGNQASNTVIVAPITSKAHKVYSFEVRVEVCGTPGKAMMNQCRAVDKSRLGKKECILDAETMKQLELP